MAWRVDTTPDGATVTAVFEGRLTEEDAVTSACAFSDAIRERPVDVVWDLREMSGYDSKAREAWQEAIWPSRRNIRSLTLIGAKPTVRVGGMMLAIFIGAPWKFVNAPQGETPPEPDRSEA